MVSNCNYDIYNLTQYDILFQSKKKFFNQKNTPRNYPWGTESLDVLLFSLRSNSELRCGYLLARALQLVTAYRQFLE